MKKRIEEYKNHLEVAKQKIRTDIKKQLQISDYKTSNNIQVLNIKSEKDLDKAYYGEGFYIILTNHYFQNNNCNFQINDRIAIYRGQCRNTKKRLKSHLANETYKKERRSNETNYRVCLKIEDGENGININQYPFNEWDWTVVIHKMKGSSKIIREQAEKAFDDLYSQPIKSRELIKENIE